MAVVKDIRHKMKINQRVATVTVICSLIMVIGAFVLSYKQIQDASKSIYILDNGVPILAKQTDLLLNRPVEYKSQIDLFHSIFFTLTPDPEYIKKQAEKALYLIDESGMKEYANLREKGFYNQIISSNSVVTLQTDSIILSPDNIRFTYYGTQTINRKSSLILRKLVSEGTLIDVPRSQNNSHGVMIQNWKILDNSDISVRQKYNQ